MRIFSQGEGLCFVESCIKGLKLYELYVCMLNVLTMSAFIRSFKKNKGQLSNRISSNNFGEHILFLKKNIIKIYTVSSQLITKLVSKAG